MVGAESGLRDVMIQVGQVAPSDTPVLLLGETGTGKEVVARAIHDRSRRARGPFLRVNCGAIPGELIDSELFGHERGSFTGAVGLRKGWFERADGGTLFLDEIGGAVWPWSTLGSSVATSPRAEPVRIPAEGGFPRLDEVVARHIESALERTAGRIEGRHGAARLLGVNPHTLRARMRKLGVEWRRFRPVGQRSRPTKRGPNRRSASGRPQHNVLQRPASGKKAAGMLRP